MSDFLKLELVNNLIVYFCNKYELDIDRDVFYCRSNEPCELVYDKNDIQIYYNFNYGYIDVIMEG